MNTGQYISGAAHIGLIGWLLVGNVFRSEPPPLEVTEVSVISAAEFDAMFAPTQAPETTTSLGELATPSEEPLEALPVPVEDAAPTLPDPLEQPVDLPAEEAPDLTGLSPTPEAEVTIDVPTMNVPSFDSSPDLEIDTSPENAPRDVPRVAPVPVIRPELDVAVAPEVTESAAPAAELEAVIEAVVEEEDAAPEEATTEIVTEAETPKGAPTSVPVPRMRPAAAATPTPPAEPETPAEDSLLSALAEAMGTEDAPVAEPTPVRSGPPLNASELDRFRVAVSQCWNTGSLSSAALRVTVIVATQMTEDGKPVPASIRLLDSTGGDDEAVTQAFEAARRAILRCGTTGYDLPKEKYSQWRDIEMTFNPEKMRIK